MSITLLAARCRKNHQPASDPYFTAVMMDSPAAYWRCDDNASNTIVTDISGHGNNATSTSVGSAFTSSISAAGLLTTSPNKAFNLNATNENTFYSNTGVNTSMDWSVECLIKPLSAPGGGVAIWNLTAGTVIGSPVLYVSDGGSTFTLSMIAESTAFIFGSSGSWAYGTRLHIVMDYDHATNTLSLYVNGALDSTGSYTFGSFSGVTFGEQERTNSNFYNGIIDECAIYQHKLGATRAAAHYAVS